MMSMDKLKSTISISGIDRRAMLMRLIITLFLLAAVLRIGS